MEWDLNEAAPQRATSFTRLRGIDAAEIKRRVLERLPEFVQWLYGGRAIVKGGEARIGDPFTGESGQSCAISLTGPDAGTFIDFADGSGLGQGNVFDLFALHMGLDRTRDFPTVLAQIAREFLGDQVDLPADPHRPSATSLIGQKKARLGDRPKAEHVKLGPLVKAWHYREPDGTLVCSMERYDLPEIDPETGKAKKLFLPRMPDRSRRMPDVRPLYGLERWAGSRQVVMVEGEKAADALLDMGIAATTMMGGANASLAKTNWAHLAGVEVTLWRDNDSPGRAWQNRLLAHLSGMGLAVRAVEPPGGSPKGWDAADLVQDGGDPFPLLRASQRLAEPIPEGDQIFSSSLALMTIEELLELPPPTYLIRGWIVSGSLAIIFGPPASYKSFIALGMALSVACGLDWNGCPVRQGRVIYLAAEGRAGFAKRAKAWLKTFADRHGYTPDLTVLPQAVNLVAQINDLIALSRQGGELVLVVIDTVARTFGGFDENSTRDMNAFVIATDRLRRETGACVLLVHHSGKDVSKGARGSTALKGAVDTEIMVDRPGGGPIVVVTCTKQKDDEEPPPLTLERLEVHVETNWGEQTSMVLRPAADPEAFDAGLPQSRPKGLTHNQRQALRAVRELVGPDGSADWDDVRSRTSDLIGTTKNVPRLLQSLEEAGLVTIGIDPDTLKKVVGLVVSGAQPTYNPR